MQIDSSDRDQSYITRLLKALHHQELDYHRGEEDVSRQNGFHRQYLYTAVGLWKSGRD
jgi:hypothetical protein